MSITEKNACAKLLLAIGKEHYSRRQTRGNLGDLEWLSEERQRLCQEALKELNGTVQVVNQLINQE